jgi:penicillin-binding protein A
VNARVGRIGVVILILFLLLFVNLNYVQVFHARALEENPNNSRRLIELYAKPRGELLASDGVVLARSEPTSDTLLRQRVYPAGPLFANPVGYLSFNFGATGLEESQAQRLLGEDEVRAADNVLDYLLAEPQPGAVRLTLDTRVQDEARTALGDQHGAVVALNPKTGAIYALWSNPSFDPNPIAGHDPAVAKAAFDATDAGDKPGLARAYGETYPPGSTFKVVVASAALKAGITPDTAFDNPSILPLPDSSVGLRNFGGGTCRADAGGRVSFHSGFVQSCNTTFAQIGLRIGPDLIRQQAELFGFDRPLPAELGVPTAASIYPPASRFERSQSSVAQSAIGQFDVRVTALQMGMVAAGVGNGGIVMQPYLVKEVLDGKGRRVFAAQPKVYSQALSPQDDQTIKSFMVEVVASGTGTAGQVPGVSVGGKTGTAQTTEDAPPHAWFIAFAPAEDPVVAVAVLVERGGSLGSEATGGQVAAPIARQVIQEVLNVKPDPGA